MASRRKIEEEIAKTKDPVLQKQLQELLDKRSQRWAEKEEKAKGFLKETADFCEGGVGAIMAVLAIVGGFVIVLVFVLRLFLWLIGYSQNFWD
jgi:hypothetical protein